MKTARFASILIVAASVLPAHAEPFDRASAVYARAAELAAQQAPKDPAQWKQTGMSLRVDPGLQDGLHDVTNFWSNVYWLSKSPVDVTMASLGYAWRNVRLEGAVYRSREPGQPDNPELIKLDASKNDLAYQLFTARKLSFDLGPNWSIRVRRGYHESPDELRDSGIRRTTASATYFGKIADNPWSTTLAWGHGANDASNITNTYLLESAVRINRVHMIFGRIERAGNDELFREQEASHQLSYRANKLTLGYLQDVVSRGPTRLTLGGLASKRIVPNEIAHYYGGSDLSYMVFLRLQMQFAAN